MFLAATNQLSTTLAGVAFPQVRLRLVAALGLLRGTCEMRPGDAKLADDAQLTSFLLLVHVQGRFSFIGAQPTLELVAKERKVTIMDHAKGTREVKVGAQVLVIAE